MTTSGISVPKMSDIMVLATPITPIPAVTLKHSIIQSCQNCGVAMARSMCTSRPLTSVERFGLGVQPAGFQSAAGTRYWKAATIITSRYTRPRVRKVCAAPVSPLPTTYSPAWPPNSAACSAEANTTSILPLAVSAKMRPLSTRVATASREPR